MFPRSLELHKEIQKLSDNLPAVNEMDDYFYSIYKLLVDFTAQDWDRLEIDLNDWEYKELRTLSIALKDKKGLFNALAGDYIFG